MPTSYTSILKLALPATGELSGTWGDVVNNNITSMVEQAIAGLATINTWTTNSHTLTTANGTTSQSRCAILVLNNDGAGNPSAAATVICPTASKIYIVRNICGQTATVKTAAGTGVAIPNNATAVVFCDGTNVLEGATYSGSVDINGGTIDGTTIGATTRSTGAFTTLTSNGATTFTAGTASTNTTTGTAVITGGLGVSGRINAANFDGVVGANTAAAGSFTTLGASSTATLNTLASSGATLTGGTINNMSVGATTRSTGAFTTLTSNGATTFTAGTASTNTTTGTAVITGGLGVSGRINAANFDGIVGANTRAAGSFTTLTSNGATTFTAGTASTSTTTGTAVITGGLGVSGRINAANFDGIVGANTAAAGSFTTVSTSGQLTNTVAIGTAPMVVTSTTRVANLNVATAGTADILTTARTINGVSFNGSANITVADATKLPLAGGTMTGAITFAAGQTWPTFNQNTTGSAATLTTARTIGMTGDVTWTSASFNGSANVTGTATLANSGVVAATYGGNNSIPSLVIDAKGRVTSASTVTPSGTWAISISGNAGTATTLATARNINGTSFNGSADITTANWGTARTLWGQSVNGSANITAPLRPAAGSVGAPAFSTSGDTNTGIYFSAADTVAISTGGTDAATFDASGNTNIIGGLGVRAGSPSANASAVLSYTLGHGNTTRYGVQNTLTIDNTTGNLTAGRVAYGTYTLLDSTIQNSTSFSHNSTGVYGLVRSGTAAGNSVDGFGIMRGGEFIVQHRTADATFTRMETVDGVRSTVQATGSTAIIDNAFGVNVELRPTVSGATINTGYLFHGTNSTVTGTFTNRWGVYIASAINNYFAGGIQIGGTATGSTSAAGLGVNTAPTGAGNINASGNIVASGSIDCGTQFLGLSTDSATAPSFSFTGDTDTGIFRPTTDQVGITTGGTARFTVTTTAITSTLPISASTFTGALSGNATTATTLQTTRAINGTNFNGSAAITTANWGTARTIWGQSINGSANITAPLLPAAGTVSAPAFSTSGDTNTGMWFPAADTLAFSEGGVEVIRINSSSNVGIGTTTPTAKLDVSGSARLGNSNYNNESIELGQQASGDRNSFIDLHSSGTPASIDYSARIIRNAGANGDYTFVNAGSGSIYWVTGVNERMRINASGNVMIGTTNPENSAKLAVVSTISSAAIACRNTTGSGGSFITFLNSGNTSAIGSITNSDNSETSFNTFSDYRLKENDQPMVGALAKVAALRPVTFTWKATGASGQGFIAHELQAVVPNAVTGKKDAVDAEGKPIYQGVDTSFLVATLVAAIQELKAEIDLLKGN